MTPAPAYPAVAWSLGNLLDGLALVQPALRSLPITQLSLDSRQVGTGTLFLARQGERAHGLEFAEEVAARGAAAIVAEPSADWNHVAISQLAEEINLPILALDKLAVQAGAIAARFHRDPSADLEMIGITGTNGKTSVTHFIAQSLGVEARCGIIGTLGEGFPGSLVATGMTTPDELRLQASLAGLASQGAEAVAMEVSSHALAQHRVDAVHFDTALLTNLTRDHLDYHADMAAYGAAKARLFESPRLRWAILNADDDFSRQVIDHSFSASAQLGLYSLNADFVPAGVFKDRCKLWLRASRLELDGRGLRMQVQTMSAQTKGELHAGEVEAALIGRFNAANLLATLAVLLARGKPLKTALRQLARVSGVAGRMECFSRPEEPLCVVDYAHTPDALAQALTELRRHCRGRVIVVFGCGGERDRGKRPLMGEAAESLADHIILTDDNPRHEDGDAIVAEIQAGIQDPSRVEIERQRAVAIRRALLLASTDDAVLIAGKGHETEQDMGELKVRFSDRAQLMQALREWRGSE